GGVLCWQTEPTEVQFADALGGGLRTALGGADGSGARTSRGELVWDAHLGRNGLQRFQTWSVGLASQQNADSALRGAAVAGDGGRSTLDGERGLSDRGARAASRR